MEAAEKASYELYDELKARSSHWASIYPQWKKFRDEQFLWSASPNRPTTTIRLPPSSAPGSRSSGERSSCNANPVSAGLFLERSRIIF